MNLPFIHKHHAEPDQLAIRLAREEIQLVWQLSEHREASGLTRDDVARALNVFPETIAEFEGLQTHPDLSFLKQYALAIGCFIEFRVHFKEEM